MGVHNIGGKSPNAHINSLAPAVTFYFLSIKMYGIFFSLHLFSNSYQLILSSFFDYQK